MFTVLVALQCMHIIEEELSNFRR